MNTTLIQDSTANNIVEIAEIELRTLAVLEIAQVGGGENVAGFY